MHVEITEKKTVYEVRGTYKDRELLMTASVDSDNRITLAPYDGEYNKFEFKNSDPALIFAMSCMAKELVNMIIEQEKEEQNV